MTTSSNSRRDPLLDCLSELHRWQPPGNFKKTLCAAVLKVVPGSHSSYSIVDLEQQTTRAAATTKISSRDDARRYLAQLNQYVLRHPCVGHWLEHPGETLTSISDVAPARRYRGSDLYNEVYRWQGVEDQLALNLTGGGPGPFHILAFSRQRRGFNALDRDRLAILRPHLISGLMRARSLARLRASESRALQQLDVLAPAAITLASSGEGEGNVFQSPCPGDSRGVVCVPPAANRRRLARGAGGLADRAARGRFGDAAPTVRALRTRRSATGRQPV